MGEGTQAEAAEPEADTARADARGHDAAHVDDAPRRLTPARRRSAPARWAPRRWLAAEIEAELVHGGLFVWLPVFMGLGAAFALARPHDIPIAAAIVPFIGFVALFVAARDRAPTLVAPLAFLAAAFAGIACQDIEVARTPTVVVDDSVVTHLTGIVESSEGDGAGHWRYTVRLLHTERPTIRRPPDRVRLLARSRHKPIPLGAGITGLARLSPPSGPALPGSYDFAFNSYFQDIGAIGFFFGAPRETSIAGAPRRRIALAIADIREAISARIRTVLPGEAGALAAALIVADRGGLPEATVDALRNAGLAHILAISGLHMALVAGTLFYALRMLLSLFPTLAQSLPIKKIAACAAFVVATAYLIMSGASVSTQRAWIMLSVVLIAVILDRPAVTLRNVALAALIVIALTPSAVVGPSFQMSFAATAALVSGYGALNRWRRGRRVFEHGLVARLLLFFAAILLTSLLAGTATDLFAAYQFQRITTLGLLGNLLAMPLVDVIVMPMGLAAVLLMPYGLEAWPLRLMGLGLDGVIASAKWVSSLGGVVGTGQIATPAIFVMAAGLVILMLSRTKLRLAGLPIGLVGLVMAVPPLAPRRADVLISEDGRLVALATRDGLAPDSARPPSFVYGQWRDAYAAPPTITPAIIGKNTRPKPKRGDRSRAPPLTPADRRALATAMQAAPEGRFTCVTRGWCVGKVDGIRVASVTDPAFLGPACDTADVVATRAFVHMTACRSGALFYSPAILRRTGAVALYARPYVTGKPRAPPVVVGALAGIIRPWTIHRYYDWRSNRFNFDGPAEAGQ